MKIRVQTQSICCSGMGPRESKDLGNRSLPCNILFIRLNSLRKSQDLIDPVPALEAGGLLLKAPASDPYSLPDLQLNSRL